MDREQTPSGIRPEAKLFRTNTYETRPIMSALTPFRMNTYGSVDSKEFYPPLKSTLMKNGGRGCPLLLTRSRRMHSISAAAEFSRRRGARVVSAAE